MTAVDVFTVAGQSNAVGRGDSAQSPTPASGTAWEYNGGSFSELSDPVDGANTGSAWPSFADTYYNRTGRKVVIVPTAVDASAQASESDTGAGNWDTTGSLQDNAVTETQNALSYLNNNGYDPTLRGILWHQGEKDGREISKGNVTKSTYRTALQDMVDAFRNDLSRPDLPLFIHTIAHDDNYSPEGYEKVRQAQYAAVSADDNVHLVSDIQHRFELERKMGDAVHYNQTGLNEMGTASAINLSYIINQ